MTIDWGLLGPPPDIAGSLQRGMELGRGIAMRNTRDRAVSALATDPNNAEAMSAFAAVDPEGAYRFERMQGERAERERQKGFRSALQGAYDPTTGTLDPTKARQAYLGAGDIPGALEFDKEQAAARAAQLKQARDNLGIMSRLIDDATDQASYDRSVAAARELGLDVSKVPPTFDPAYVATLKQQAAALLADVERKIVVIDGVAMDQRTGEPLFESPYPRIINGPGGIYEQPRVGFGRGGTGAAPTGRVVEGELPPGWTVVEEGGPGQGGPGTFP